MTINPNLSPDLRSAHAFSSLDEKARAIRDFDKFTYDGVFEVGQVGTESPIMTYRKQMSGPLNSQGNLKPGQVHKVANLSYASPLVTQRTNVTYNDKSARMNPQNRDLHYPPQNHSHYPSQFPQSFNNNLINKNDVMPQHHRARPKNWELIADRVLNAKELRRRHVWGQALSAYARMDNKMRKKTPAPAVTCPQCECMVPVFSVEIDANFKMLLKENAAGKIGKIDQPTDWNAVNEEKERKRQLELKQMREAHGDDVGDLLDLGENFGAKVDLGVSDEEQEAEEEIEESVLGDDLTHDEIYRLCQDKKTEIVALKEELRDTKKQLKEQIEEREDAEHAEKTWREKFRTASDKEKMMKEQVDSFFEVKSMLEADRDTFQSMSADFANKWRNAKKKHLQQMDKLHDNHFAPKTNEDLKREFFMHWFAYAHCQQTLRRSASELFKVKSKYDDLVVEKKLLDEKVQNSESKIETLIYKVKTQGNKIIQKHLAPIPPLDEYESLNAKRFCFNAWKNNMRELKTDKRCSELEKRDAIVTEKARVLEEEAIQLRQEIIGFKQRIVELDYEVNQLKQDKECAVMYTEEIITKQRSHMYHQICANSEKVSLYERLIKEDEIANLQQLFEEERKTYKREIESLEEILEEAKRMGNDPYAAARVRVVPRGEGVVCSTCMAQVLTRKVQKLAVESDTDKVKKDFFKKDMEGLIRSDDYEVAQAQINGHMDRFDRNSSNRIRNRYGNNNGVDSMASTRMGNTGDDWMRSTQQSFGRGRSRSPDAFRSSGVSFNGYEDRVYDIGVLGSRARDRSRSARSQSREDYERIHKNPRYNKSLWSPRAVIEGAKHQTKQQARF